MSSKFRCELRDWVVREDLDWVTISTSSSGTAILHSVDSGCIQEPADEIKRDRAWAATARLDEIRLSEESGERTMYFCERCVIRRLDSQPREHRTGGNALCPKCFLHHAGDCV